MNKEYIDLKRRIVYRGEVYQAIEDERIKALPAMLGNSYMTGVHDGLKKALVALANNVNDIPTAAVAVENAPTVDAVPVIRCEDCVYRDRECYCLMIDMETEPDFFCKYGIRKEVHADEPIHP